MQFRKKAAQEHPGRSPPQTSRPPERDGTISAISRIESGQHPTTVQTLRRLAQALETHLVVGFVDEIAELGDSPGIDAREADLVAVG